MSFVIRDLISDHAFLKPSLQKQTSIMLDASFTDPQVTYKTKRLHPAVQWYNRVSNVHRLQNL
jgi:hypothetical protein